MCIRDRPCDFIVSKVMPIGAVKFVKIAAVFKMKHCARGAFCNRGVLPVKSLRPRFYVAPHQILSGYLEIPLGTNIHRSGRMAHKRYIVKEAPVAETLVIVLFETDIYCA